MLNDVLKVNLKALLAEEFGDKPVAVCANLPYYITSPILMRLLEEKLPIENITVMHTFISVYYLLNNSIAFLILSTDSALPRTSMISVAPPGVFCFPETAVLTGHITYPFL